MRERDAQKERESGRDSRSCRISDSQREKLAQRETERRTEVQIPIQKDQKGATGREAATRCASSKVSVGEKEQSISSARAGPKWWENYM